MPSIRRTTGIMKAEGKTHVNNRKIPPLQKKQGICLLFCSKSFSAHCTTSMAWSYDSCNGIIEKVKVYIDKDVHE